MAKIVVLDAEPLVRSIVARILSRAGHQIQEVADLDAALHQLAQAPANLIITNVYLPGVTGHEALKAIKTQNPDIPVLMVSGLPDSDVIDRWQSEPGWSVFPKPFAPRDLLSKVDEVLKQSQQEKSAAGS